MPEQSYGGDDDNAKAPETQKKLKLSRFELGPDLNIRETFLRLLSLYDDSKDPAINFDEFATHKFAFEKCAVSLMESKEGNLYGMSHQLVARNTTMMFLDANWEDAFLQFINDMRESKMEGWKYVVNAIRHILQYEKYRQKLFDHFKKSIRDSNGYSTALFYLPKLKDSTLISEMKREISIYARGDSEENQGNAMDALSVISEDEEARNVLMSLLNHWDAGVRRKAAGIMKNMKMDEKIAEFIEKKAETETDEDIKKILKKKVMSWKKK